MFLKSAILLVNRLALGADNFRPIEIIHSSAQSIIELTTCDQ